MSINIYKVDVGINFIDFTSDLIKEQLTQYKKIVFISANKRPIWFIKKNLPLDTNLRVDFFTIEDFIKNLVINFSDNIPKIHTSLERALFFFELIKSYKRFGEDNAKILPWALRVSKLFDDIDKQLLGENLKNFKYVEAVEPAKDILENLKTLYKRYRETYDYLYNGLFFEKAANITGQNQFIQHFKDTLFIFAGIVYLSNSEFSILKNIASNFNTIFLIQTDLFHREVINFDTFKIVEDVITRLKKAKKIKITEIKKHKKIPEIKFFQFSDTHSEVSFVANYFRDNSAIILPESSSLFPLLSFLEKSKIKDVNITMGYPLANTEIGLFINSFFLFLMDLERKYKSTKKYLASSNLLLKLLNSAIVKLLIDAKEMKKELFNAKSANFEIDINSSFFKKIVAPFIKIKTIEELYNAFIYLYNHFNLSILKQNKFLFQIINQFFNDVINPLKTLSFKENINLHFSYTILKELIKELSIPFQGHPLSGLQIMGLLEARLLSFEQLIIIDVNEGIIPSIDKIDPLLPEDIKKEIGLPSFTEKEALIRYNFFRLLYSSKQAIITFKSGSNTIEKFTKSRFIEQLIFLKEVNEKKPFKITSPYQVNITLKTEKNFLKKDELIHTHFKEILSKPMPPSTLNQYLMCPYSYYLKYIKNIQERIIFDNDLPANMIGSLVHKLLEINFQKYREITINSEILKKIKDNIISDIKNLPESINEYSELYEFLKKISDFQLKSLKIILEYRLNYFLNFLLEKNESFKILHIEEQLQNSEENIFGYIDRIDLVDEYVRIVDYKTGVFTPLPNEKKIINFFENNELSSPKFDLEELKLFKELVGSTQMPCYLYLAQKKYTEYPVKSVIYHIGTPDKMNIEKELTDENLDYFMELIRLIKQHMLYSEYIYPLPDENCNYCEFKYLCRYI